MEPMDVPLKLKKGDSFSMPVRLHEKNTDGSFKQWLNLTTWDLKAQVRPSAGTTGTPMVEMQFTKADQTVLPGAFWVWYTKEQGQSLTVAAVAAHWDLEITEQGASGFETGRRFTIMDGAVVITEDVTKT